MSSSGGPRDDGGKPLAPDLSFMVLWIKNIVRIGNVRKPECCLGGGRIDRQSELPAPLDFSVVFIHIGDAVVQDRIRGCRTRCGRRGGASSSALPVGDGCCSCEDMFKLFF